MSLCSEESFSRKTPETALTLTGHPEHQAHDSAVSAIG